ncbi:radical SAM protein [Desulfoscipio gibsoniae]|uniref:Fe-S oxidoreductase n=1 Tax=Desulfoscipio gibsoniae DSM 7213 TaxID=767817 RepID=R4KNP7_9FIRM|nr:radical SAM protein [Desulfoscipio gibsoniae]AGL03187.1 Fe-S oxidoreductase [Desulfoscipio gibsoniae DSM 7213]
MIVYGPVPSRRLGHSIGINNIPPKTCSYSCIYCQLGRTDRMQVKRREFYKPEEIFHGAELKIKQLNSKNEHVDYFSFVPDGEPTLDINLGTEIDLLRYFDIKIAVITNASLIWMDDVKEDLMKADWVSVSIDAVDEDTWRKIDRPHGSLRQQDIFNGIIEFSKTYKGTLVTETMLVDGVNDHDACIKKVAEHLGVIHPKKAYLLVPTRPPAENSIKRSSRESLVNAAEIIRSISGAHVECITGDEKEEGFFFSEDIVNDLLSISSVHPVREDIVNEILEKRNVDKAVIDDLLKRDMIVEFLYEGKKFYRKNLKNKQKT